MKMIHNLCPLDFLRKEVHAKHMTLFVSIKGKKIFSRKLMNVILYVQRIL